MKGVGKILDWACRAGEIVAMAMLAVVTVLILIQIVGRELLNDGMPWADELARLAGMGLIFLAAPLLLARDLHVKVDYFANLLPELPRRLLGRAVDFLTATFCVLFLIAGWYFLQRAGRFATPALAMPNLLFYLPAILGTALLALVAVHRLFTPHATSTVVERVHGG